jgi:Holliday junction resolvase
MEKKFRNMIMEFLKDTGAFAYHIRDVKNTGPRIADIICCMEGKFVAIELKAKMKQDITPDEVLELLSSYQKMCAREIIKSGGIYYVFVFLYNKQSIKLEGTYGNVYYYKLNLSADGRLFAELKKVEYNILIR